MTTRALICFVAVLYPVTSQISSGVSAIDIWFNFSFLLTVHRVPGGHLLKSSKGIIKPQTERAPSERSAAVFALGAEATVWDCECNKN
jgi:hypothetical protein